MTDRTLDLVATATFGLEAVVRRELDALGYQAHVVQPGRLLFEAEAKAIARANLWLRTSDRLLLRLGTFEAADFDALFEGTRTLPWDQWIPEDGRVPVRGRSVDSQLSSVPACQSIVKKAIVEQMRSAHGVETLPETGADYAVEVHLLKNQASLSLDTSGAGLHKRGYRPISGEAPLKETLAAALVLLSFWRRDRPLWDPFCGTGTIPIEAALVGRNRAPGIRRTFAAESWSSLPDDLWKRAREEARDLETKERLGPLFGSDIDEKALEQARFHAREAGLSEEIRFEPRDFLEDPIELPDGDYGCLITNPPYGERLAGRRDVETLYRTMPNVFRRLPTWSHYVLTAWRDFEDLAGQPADRRRKLYIGRIECTYFQYHGPRPGSSDQPAFGGLGAKEARQVDDFGNRLKKRAHHLRKWPKKLGIECYRLYERDIKEVTLVVDRYGESLHIVEIDYPKFRAPAQQSEWLELMAARASEVLGTPRENVFVKRKRRQRGSDQHERVASEHQSFIVSERDLRFEVNLSDYVDTGLFLDHRDTRQLVREMASGKRFLNLFCYTGSFTVYAAAGGARTTTSVDASRPYLDWAERNLERNGFDEPKHQLICQDIWEYLDHPPREPYDLAVLDAPTFSNSKSRERDFIVERDHPEVINRVLRLLSPGGILFFCTNFRRFKLAREKLETSLCEEITPATIPDDFRNRKVHRSWRLTKSRSTP